MNGQKIDNEMWARAVEFLSKADPSKDWSESMLTMWLCAFAERESVELKRELSDANARWDTHWAHTN